MGDMTLSFFYCIFTFIYALGKDLLVSLLECNNIVRSETF